MRDQTTANVRFVDLEELRCPCGEHVDDGRGGFADRDGSQLCEDEPVEVTRWPR